MRWTKLILCATFLLGGCGTLIKDRSQVPMSPIGGFGTTVGTKATKPPPAYGDAKTWQNSDVKAWQNADVITLDLPGLLDSYSGVPSEHNFEQALANFSRIGDQARLKQGRNEIVGAVLMASEKNCEVYLEYFHGNQIAIKGTSSVLAALFSGAATVTTPIRSSKILAAISGFSTSAGGNLSDAIFSSRAADAIASGINADRAGLKEVILKNMTDKEYSPWPLSAALSDAITYHSRCNAISGLAFLQGTAEAKKAQSEKTAPPPPAK